MSAEPFGETPASMEHEPAEIWAQTWRELVSATRDRRHAFRHPVVATHDPHHGVSARSVVLREAEPQAARLSFHSDRRTRKIAGLEIAPRLSGCFYDAERRIQLRAECSASLHVGDAVARAWWTPLDAEARSHYATVEAPGTSLAAGCAPALAEGDEAGFENFAVVMCAVEALDWLHLGPPRQRRIRFTRQRAGWRGISIVP